MLLVNTAALLLCMTQKLLYYHFYTEIYDVWFLITEYNKEDEYYDKLFIIKK